MKRYLRLLTSFLLAGYMSMSMVCAQENEYIPASPSYVLPSPTSQAYQHFMGFEPDLATGAVNVNIPLCTLEYDDFSLPFSLNYQSNGIKPSDSFFPLGYGWMLHPGLRITRTILGKPDEVAPDKTSLTQTQNDECSFKYLTQAGRQEDTMYDVFTLSLPQGQTTFLVTGTNPNSSNWNVVTACDRYQIEPLKSSFGTYLFGFKVTDENGIVYYFGETSDPGNNAVSDFIECSRQNGSLVPTTYLMRKAVLPGNKEVTFTWKAGAGMDIAYENYYDIVDGYQQFFQPDVPIEKDFGEGEHQYITDGPTIMGSSLESVNFPGGKIELNYNAYQLSGMYLYDKQNKLVRTVSFTHSDYLLQSITIDKEQTYSFDYNEQGFTYSHGVDFWGYYNGVDNGYTSHPALTYTSYQFIQGGCYGRTLTCSGADRNPNASCMQANMLVQVNYPTGGYTRFEYEPNSYKTAEKEGIVQGGGLRVKKIINGTNGPDGDRQVIKTYLYGNNACGYGSCSVHIDERAFVSEFFCYHSVVPDIYSYRRLTVHANHLYGSYLLFNHPVWYPEVTELLPDGSKQVYQYRYNPDAIGECDASMPSIFNSYPRDYRTRVSFEFNHLFDRNPQLERLKVYDKQGELVSEKDFAYMAIKGSPLNLVGINFRQVYQDIAYYNNQCSPYAEYDYLLASIRAEQYYLSSETEKTDGVTVKREYQRNRSDMPVRTVVTHADGTVTEESYLYADDDLSSLTAEQQTCKSILQSNHRITQPVCKRKKVNGVQVMQKVIRYGASGSGNKYVYPVEEYYRTGNYPEESRVEYLRYNSLGKPVEVTVDGHHIIYLWGYQGQYPVAVIENATYQEVQSVISQTLQEEIASAIIPASTHWSILNNLRSRLPLALVKTYTYQPLVGMLSETDPAGQTVYYTYDVCGRLTEIYRMASGKKEMIETYEYEY